MSEIMAWLLPMALATAALAPPPPPPVDATSERVRELRRQLHGHGRQATWEEPDVLAVATWRNSGQLSHGEHDESEITP